MPIIKSPVPDYTGQTGSVVFVNGEGFTEDANHIEWFKEHGYDVVDPTPEPAPETKPETVPDTPPTTETVTDPTPEPAPETNKKSGSGKGNLKK